MILFQCSNVVFGDPIVDIESLGEPVNVVRFFPEQVDNAASVGPASGPGEYIP